MAMIKSNTYEFKSICNVMDFVKPLIVEGYSVAINTVYEAIPFENSIDKFTVDGDQVAIDGFDEVTYKSMCPRCYLKKVKKLVKNKND